MGIFKDKKSPYYQFAFTHKGIRYRGSTETDKRADAETIYHSERRRILLGEELQQDITLEEAFAKYQEVHAMFLASYNRVEDHVNAFLKHFGKGRMLSTIDHDAMEKCMAKFRAETYQVMVYSHKQKEMVAAKDREGKFLPKRLLQPATINYRMAIFQTMHKKAKRTWKLKLPDIWFDELKLKVSNIADNTIKKDDPQKLFDVAPVHLQNFIVISLYLGWRMTNVLLIDGTKQIDLDKGIAWTFGKGNKYIESEITDDFRQYIIANNLHLNPMPCGYKGNFVKSIATAWETMFKNAGVKYIRRHDLRHTFGTWLYNKHGDQRLVKDALKHSRIETSERYTHPDREIRREKLNQALDFKITQIKGAK